MRYVLTFAACAAFLHSSSAFAPSALPIRSAPALALRTAAPIAARLPRTRLAAAVRLAMVTKESPLEAGGLRGIEEEERRVTLWTNHFDLSTEQVASLRNEFEAFLKKESCELRNVGYASLKKIVEAANADIDLADVDDGELAEGGRPRVTEEELNNYVKALGPLWADTCDMDAVETANGECFLPLDTNRFDLSESLAIFGMCLRDHCGIGGVCFWDSE